MFDLKIKEDKKYKILMGLFLPYALPFPHLLVYWINMEIHNKVFNLVLKVNTLFFAYFIFSFFSWARNSNLTLFNQTFKVFVHSKKPKYAVGKYSMPRHCTDLQLYLYRGMQIYLSLLLVKQRNIWLESFINHCVVCRILFNTKMLHK